MPISKAGARLKAIARAKMVNAWNVPYRMHNKVRVTLDQRVEDEKERRRRQQIERYVENLRQQAIAALADNALELSDSRADDQPAYLQ